jgi:hypothetical protein
MITESQSEYEKVLNKAKSKYRDAVRGFEYQEELLKTELNLDETIFITKRKNKFLAEFTILEDVFGSALFDESIEVHKTPKKSFYSPRVQEIADEIDIKMQQLGDLEDKIARRQQNEKNN